MSETIWIPLSFWFVRGDAADEIIAQPVIANQNELLVADSYIFDLGKGIIGEDQTFKPMR